MSNNILNKVDFSKSSIGWFDASSGIFRLASILEVSKIKNEKPKMYGLGLPVIAGNVYNKENLIQDPSYLFQVAGNIDEQIIFRSDVPNSNKKLNYFFKKRKKILDSDLSLHFKDFKLKVVYRNVKKISNYEEVERYFRFNDFSAQIQIYDFNGINFKIEFPINHINIFPKKKQWQIETGPILFINKVNIDKDCNKFLPCFLHFNNFNSIDIFYDYPYGYRNKKNNIIKNINCSIEIYTMI